MGYLAVPTCPCDRKGESESMSTPAIIRELFADRPEVVARGLRRLARWCGTDAESGKRPEDFESRRQELLERDCEARLLGLAAGDDDVLRELAMDALGAFAGDAALEALLTGCSDSVTEVRASAAGALESWPEDSRVRDALLTAVDDEKWLVRMRAARAMSAFEDEEVLDALLEALVDPDSFVRYGAADALRHKRSGAFLSRLRRHFDFPGPHMLDATMDLIADVGAAEDARFLAKVGGWTNFPQPGYVKRWARKAAGRIRGRLRGQQPSG